MRNMTQEQHVFLQWRAPFALVAMRGELRQREKFSWSESGQAIGPKGDWLKAFTWARWGQTGRCGVDGGVSALPSVNRQLQLCGA